MDLGIASRRAIVCASSRGLGRPDELAAACLYLCSEQASFVSGQNLQLDGGSYAGLL